MGRLVLSWGSLMLSSPLKLEVIRQITAAIALGRSSRQEEFQLAVFALEKRIEELEPSERTRQLRVLELIKASFGLMVSEPTVSQAMQLNLLPVFVIVTPAFQAAKFIDDTIASVVGQRGGMKVRYHVQDGGSTDGTIEILKAWEERLKEQNSFGGAHVQFSWESKKDAGMYDGISRGFECAYGNLDERSASTSLMTWLNADDMLAANSLVTAWSFFAEHPEFHWITGLCGLMNESGAVVSVMQEPPVFSQTHLAMGRHDGRRFPFVQQEGCFWRMALWRTAGGLNRSLKLAGDWDLWRRFAALTPLMKLQTVLGLHRRHAAQKTSIITGYHLEVDDLLQRDVPEVNNLRNFGFSGRYDPSAQRWNAIEMPAPDDGDQYGAPPAPGSPEAEFHEPPSSVPVSTAALHWALPTTLPGGRPWPRISIVTPSFNQGRYIADTIESVIAQGYPNLEHIVIDGGSTDETINVLDRYRDKLAHVVSERDRGQSDALNKGFRLATGDVLCWLNSDDQFAPGALAAVAMAFATHDVDMVSGICEIYENDQLAFRHTTSCADGPLPLNDLLDLDHGWNAGQFFYQPEVFFSRKLWVQSGAHVREDCHYSMDYELWCRFAVVGARLHVIGAPLARFRVHPEQKTADPAKFKAELVAVRKEFAESRSIAIHPSARPALQWDRSLRVAIVNDLGAQYGAGIAQNRLAAGIDMAGHDVEWFDLTSLADSDSHDSVVREVVAYRPDLVLFGNLHARTRESIDVIEQLSARFPTFWVTHDFWLFTGRCAYAGSCQRYLTGCDASCPTPDEYPSLSPERIHHAWARKRSLLAGPNPPVILANSQWSADFVAKLISKSPERLNLTVERIRLGAPAHLFKPLDRQQARLAVGLPKDAFVITFSTSSMTDERKGGALLLKALRDLQVYDVVVLLIGNLDSAFEIPGLNVVSLGYVSDNATLVNAISASDVYVGPSTEETFGQVFIEAALLGVPSIGFDQSGVVDAIADGVTGLRVECSAKSLRDAITHLYDDREYCRNLGRWARIYAANEFTLETSYRSLFNVWRSLGLIDRWQLPHKVSFGRPSRFIDGALGPLSLWQAVDGISSTEGPYPTSGIPTAFRWCHGNTIAVRLNCLEGGRRKVRFNYYCNLFERIELKLRLNGEPIGEVTVYRTRAEESGSFSLVLEGRRAWNRLELLPDRVQPPFGQEHRALTFMLKDIDLLVSNADPLEECA
jgi:glycosyltransferase involved in cell wall biosynthesis